MLVEHCYKIAILLQNIQTSFNCRTCSYVTISCRILSQKDHLTSSLTTQSSQQSQGREHSTARDASFPAHTCREHVFSRAKVGHRAAAAAGLTCTRVGSTRQPTGTNYAMAASLRGSANQRRRTTNVNTGAHG